MAIDRTKASAPAGLLSTVAFSFLGAVLGGAMGGDDEMLFGLAIGFLFARVRLAQLHAKTLVAHLGEMTDRLDRLEHLADTAQPAPAGVERRDELRGATPQPGEPAATAPTTEGRPTPDEAIGASTRPPVPTPTPPSRPTRVPPPPGLPAEPPGPTPVDRAIVAMRELLLGGNTVVRGGILVLLVGVTLLARWAAEHSLFPVEARLALAALIGLALTGVGFWLRDTRPAFGTTLQGGGLAALYV
ncbi:MAG: DUF2339 domain-containing protein, partial [Actinomycetota bacterium]|nr:DUF2339 domain-containing protein [Actinomycetota bacterium]